MTGKLLEKSRNTFLFLTPPENLIPKKPVKVSKKKQYQNNHIKKRGAPLKTLNKFFHEKGININNRHMTNRLILDNFSWENGDIIPPRDHYTIDKLHFTIGGNISRFLKTQPSASPNIPTPISTIWRSGGCASRIWRQNERKSRELLTVALEKTTHESASPKKNVSISPFFLKWNQGNFSLADFIKAQLYENIWKNLFSSYDLNYAYNTGSKSYRAPIRMGSQHKNELMELRKIAMFYGNLSRGFLTSLMKRWGGKKFLSTLERRLDVALKRALFFPTIRAARQWINQGKILVNNEPILYGGYLLQPGDLISIKERYKNSWKKEWFKNFKDPLSLRDKPIPGKENPYGLLGCFIGPRKRFLCPPRLMKKWDKWCQLWGNSISPGKTGHRWSKQDYTPDLSLHPTFNMSVCADNLYLKSLMQLRNNLYKLRYCHRQSTPILFWLEELYRNSFYRKKQKYYMLQLISSLLLLQMGGRVIDGLFQQRWGRLFTKKKRGTLKKKNCQWGGIKPMHLECSYSCASVIYLFTPQKLVWPSHINVSLLKSALNG